MDELNIAIEFLKALVIPVLPAAVIIAFLVDHVLKRIPGWKDGNSGYASLALNFLFSGGLFIAAKLGYAEPYLVVLTQVGVIFTLLLTIGGGFLATGIAHRAALRGGIGKSVSQDTYATLYQPPAVNESTEPWKSPYASSAPVAPPEGILEFPASGAAPDQGASADTDVVPPYPPAAG
jgi:hypothetical protein